MAYSKNTVNISVRNLQNVALRLGMRNRYEVEWGARGTGVSHHILDFDPNFTKPHRTVVGRTFAEAERFISGMVAGLESVYWERNRQEEILELGRIRQSVSFADPDARSRTRAAEERALPTLPTPEEARSVSAAEAASMVRPARTRSEPDGFHPVKPV